MSVATPSATPPAPPPHLLARATLSELMTPLFEGWAGYVDRPPPSRKLVGNWAWERDKSHFPAPCGARPRRYGGRDISEYDVTQVLIWYCEQRPLRRDTWQQRRATGAPAHAS